MKVLHILHSFPPAFRIGGPALSVSSLIYELQNQELTFNTVYATNLDLNKLINVPIQKETQINNVKVFYFPILQFKFFNKINKYFRRWYLSLSLIKFVFNNVKSFDIVHIHMPFIASSFATAIICIFFKVPYIISYRGCLDPERIRQNSFVKKIYINIVERLLFKFSKSVHALTKKEENIISNYFSSKKIFILPNGIYCSGNLNIHSKVLNFEKKINILFISRIERIKGALFLAENFDNYLNKKLFSKEINIDFVGPLEKKFDEYNSKFINIIEKSKFMNFHGPKTGFEKQEFLSKAHFIILPSLSEGLPMTILESLALGIPVIITPQCNIPEVNDYEAGYVIEPNSDNLLKTLNMIENLSFIDYQNKCKNALNLCQDKFDIVNLAKKYYHFYQNNR